MFSKHSLFNHPLIRIAVISLLGQSFVAQAFPPIWWSEGTPPAIDPNAPVENHGIANIGQAKWMAKNALDALRTVSPTLADQVEEDLVGENLPITSWAAPTNPADQEKQKSPLLIGQLKAIALPFYNRLNANDSNWVLTQIQENHSNSAVLGTHYWQITDNANYTPGGYYPWNPNSTVDSNLSAATIGQVKAIFSLRLEQFPLRFVDNDNDGMDDNWEIANQINPADDGSVDLNNGPNGDQDNDGVINIEEFESGSNPNDAADFPLHMITAERWEFGRGLVASGNDSWAFYHVFGWSPDPPLSSNEDHFSLDLMLGKLADFPYPDTPSEATDGFVRNFARSTGVISGTSTNSDGSISEATLRQQGVWLKAPPKPEFREFNFLRVTEKKNHTATPPPAPTVTIDPITIQIQPNETYSARYELAALPDLAAGSSMSAYCRLLPVEVKDGDRTLTSLSRDEDPWTNANIQRQIPDSAIAWITGNTGAGNTPEMPKINAKIVGGPASMNVRWRFECEYRRGNGYRQAYVSDFTRAEDKVGIPKRDGSEYTEELPASQEWKIYEHPKWIQELNQNGFFGGVGKVFLKLKDQPEIEVCRFRIGGRNPDEAVAKSYINSKAGSSYWYAYAVAKHETFGRVPSRFYNQFYTDHQPTGGRIGDTANDMGWVAWAKAWPLYNLDRSYSRSNGYRQNGPGGYGMFQLTLGPKTPGGDQSSEGFITRAQIWNWQENCNRAITELQDKMTNAINLKNALESGYPNWPQVDSATYGRLGGRDASVLTYYNGMFGGQINSVSVGRRSIKTCWWPNQRGSGNNVQRSWGFLQNINDYVQHANSQIE